MAGPRDRLRNLEGLLKSSGGALLRGSQLSGRKSERAESLLHWAEELGGREIETPEGRCLYFEHRFEWERAWGDWTLDRLRGLSCDDLDLFCNSHESPGCTHRDIAFLDIESTGLYGGTGTYAFLVAVGAIEDDAFAVRQYFMRDFGEEPAQLSALEEGLSPFSAVSSFNGKSFDVPFLVSRFITQRKRFCAESWPHFDVLFPARRLWRARLADCTLQRLEREIFGMTRTGDIAGELIPRTYFSFIRGRGLEEMAAVVRHNARDVVSTALLFAHLSRVRLLADELEHPEDLAGLARWMMAARREAEARELYARVLAMPRLPGALWWESCKHLGALCKRARDWDAALDIWQQMARRNPRLDSFPVVEAAKYHEHRGRQLDRALAVLDKYLAELEVAAGVGRAADVDQAPLLHRRARLVRKLANAATAEDLDVIES